MRGRFASQVRQSHEVCFFCAFRNGREPLLSNRTTGFRSKSYHSSSPTQKPAQATATQPEEDEDEAYPVEKQKNQTTWQPFRPPPRRAQRSFAHSNNDSPDDPDTIRSSDRRYAFELRKRWEAPYREARPQQSAAGSRYGRQTSIEDQQPRSFGFKSFRPDESTMAQEDDSDSAIRTVSVRPFAQRSRTPNTFSKRDSRPQEPSNNTALGRSASERDIVDPSFGSDGADIDMPFSEQEEFHRQRQQKDKKKRRQDRFEVDEDVQTEPPKQTSLKEKPRSALRSREHDFEMMEAEDALYGETRRNKKKARGSSAATEAQRPRIVLPEFVRVDKLAQLMKIKLDDLVNKLEEEGFESARYDHLLDAETSSMIADIYNFDIATMDTASTNDLFARPPAEDISVIPPRPPIVTIMGHVDHGKTTILDWLRKSSVAAGEHGGITQHIGAFSVTMPGSERQITFLDTPGHEAFLDMRKRGANVTDIVVLVVAADDSVKPQTVEAIKHALDAKVQIIIAINKVDKEDASIERVKQDLTRHNIVVEDYGGEYQAIPVSGKTGRGMEELEEAIVTLSDVLDLRAEQDGPAEGSIIESKVTNAGRVATILVRRGSLRTGDCIVAGTTWARVRTLKNDAGHLVDQALPGDPVQVDGWRESDPTAGLEVLQAENEQHAKEVIEFRLEAAETAQISANMGSINASRTQEAEARSKVLEWEKENQVSRRHRDNEGWVESTSMTGPKKVPFVVKADVAGSVEAIVAAISAIGNHEIQANVIFSGTGLLTESDMRMLATTGEIGYAISFNQPIDGQMYRLAEAAGLSILDHNIIYKVTDEVKAKIEEQLPPVVTQRVLGEAEIGQIFDVTVKKKKIRIAGCNISNGTINRANKVRVIRNGETVYTGMLSSLKNVKKDVTEMRKGNECGMGFEDWEQFQPGDQIQSFEEKEEKKKLY